MLASTLSLCAVGSATVPSHKCDNPLHVEGRPKCARQSLASTVSAPHVAATSYCDPSRHANVVTYSSTAKLRIWTLRIWGFRGPGSRSARQLLCGDASRLFLDHFAKHLSSGLGRTELCHEVRNPGPQKPQIIRNQDHHLALLGLSCSLNMPPFKRAQNVHVGSPDPKDLAVLKILRRINSLLPY